jgi:hypothetical protein
MAGLNTSDSDFTESQATRSIKKIVRSGGLENPSIGITPYEQQHLGCDLGLSRAERS